jgi:hypothetical protein
MFGQPDCQGACGEPTCNAVTLPNKASSHCTRSELNRASHSISKTIKYHGIPGCRTGAMHGWQGGKLSTSANGTLEASRDNAEVSRAEKVTCWFAWLRWLGDSFWKTGWSVSNSLSRTRFLVNAHSLTKMRSASMKQKCDRERSSAKKSATYMIHGAH